MSVKVRSSLHSLVIIVVLLFSAVGTTVVYADGGTTPDTPPTQPSTSENNTTTPAPATDSNVHPGHKKRAITPSADSASLKHLPKNTILQVVNAQGQAEPLATQAAADAIATTSDPIWCPAGQAPTPGANGCTSSFGSFTQLLTFLAGNTAYQGAGTIYVQQGTYTSSETVIDFNSFNLSNISSADLTIQGGWNTSTNTVDTAATSDFKNIAFTIGSSTNPWGGTLTINNLNLNFTPTGHSGSGLIVTSQSDINVSNVTVTNSATGAGAELNSGANVTIKNSTFDRNKTAGVIIRSKGNVAVSNSSFSNPTNGRRQITGLDIVADGSVALADVLANTNREAGATINAGGRVSIANSSFSDTKAMQGSNFVGYGLQVVTPDAIDLSTVTANTNFLWGASLNAGGDVAIADSQFNANSTASPGFIDDTGLLVTSGGAVSITGSQANDNRLIGATITAKGDVSINNSTFTGNKGTTVSGTTTTYHGYGLNVVTDGNINLTGVTASNNTLFGAHLESGLDVNILNSDFSGQTTGSTSDVLGRGLEVVSGGLVILDHVTLNNNQTFGANINAKTGVFLDTVTATGNGQNGVEIQGNCSTLFLIGGTFSNNGQYGLSVLDAQLNQSGTPVFAGNGVGDIFTAPTTCVFTVPATPSTPSTPETPSTPSTPSTPPTDSTGSTTTTNVSAFGMTSPVTSPVNYVVLGSYMGTVSKGTGEANSLGNVTLSSYFAARGLHLGLFMGKYAYVYSLYGMQIVAYYPSDSSSLAMVGPH